MLQVTAYLQIDSFLEIWIFGSKYCSKCDLQIKKNVEKDLILAEKSRFHVFAGRKSLPLD